MMHRHCLRRARLRPVWFCADIYRPAAAISCHWGHYMLSSRDSFPEGSRRICPLRWVSFLNPWPVRSQVYLAMAQVVIVKPSNGVSTAQAYSGVTPSMPPVSLEDLLKNDISQWKDTVFNDFEKSVFPLRHMLMFLDIAVFILITAKMLPNTLKTIF